MNNPSTLTLADRYRLEPARAEFIVMLQAMAANNFNRSATAKALGIDRKTFYNKYDKYKAMFPDVVMFVETPKQPVPEFPKGCPDIGVPLKFKCEDVIVINQPPCEVRGIADSNQEP